jgi:hypothetical protein
MQGEYHRDFWRAYTLKEKAALKLTATDPKCSCCSKQITSTGHRFWLPVLNNGTGVYLCYGCHVAYIAAPYHILLSDDKKVPYDGQQKLGL